MATMAVFVRQDGIQLTIAQGCLVYSQMVTKVVTEEDPVGGMALLVPLVVVAQVVAVVRAQLMGIHMDEIGHALDAHGMVTDVAVLKKHRTRPLSGSRELPCPNHGYKPCRFPCHASGGESHVDKPSCHGYLLWLG